MGYTITTLLRKQFRISYNLLFWVLILTLAISSSKNASAQTLHERMLYQIAKPTTALSKTAQIEVGDSPSTVRVDDYSHTAYVVNRGSNTVSAIDLKNTVKAKDMPVGRDPRDIAIDIDSDIAYVVNFHSNGVSVIDTEMNGPVAGVIFLLSPINSGLIKCDGVDTPSPIGQFIYLHSGAQCKAEPNDGFEFVSWQQNLKVNSTQLIESNSSYWWTPITKLFGANSSSTKPQPNLNVTQFGTFTANFKEIHPPIPPEYWLPIYGIVVSTIVGWSIPSIIAWTKSKEDARKFNHYHNQINSLDDNKLDEKHLKA